MKISEELSDSYLHCLASSNGNVKTVCDALQQAVAENLELKFRLHHRIEGFLCIVCPFSDPGGDKRHYFNGDADWLAEADKLLRGKK